MDNRIFNVNGEGLDMLVQTLKLVFRQEGANTKAKAWRFIPGKGFVLLWHANTNSGATAFPVPMEPEEVAPLVMRWLETPEAQEMACEGWDKDEDHDGSNDRGWRVYCEDWGHVGGESYAICAIRPVFLWYGK